MGVRNPVTVLLLVCVLCTTCTAFQSSRRDLDTACERLRTAGMAVYNDGQFILEDLHLMGGYPPQRISEILCGIADARTLEDVTAAIDPDLPPFIRDSIQLYYLAGTSLIEYMGGVDGIKARVNFLRAWADLARDNNLGEDPVSYDVAYEFTSGLVNTYGADILKTFGRGQRAFTGAAGVRFTPLLNEDDVLDPESLARALSEDESIDYTTFSETSGLSMSTTESLWNFIQAVTSREADHLYPMIERFVESYLVFLETLDDMQLLDLELAA